MGNLKDTKAIERFLQQTSAVFKHRFNKNVFSARVTLEDLKEIVSSDKPEKQDILKCLERLNVFIEEIAAVADNHTKELLDLFKLQSVNLLEMTERAIHQLVTTEISIEIERASSSINIKATQLLIEHIAEILNNSIAAIRRHYPPANEKKGKIRINFIKENTQENIVELKITDNAGGVDPKIVNKIMVSGFTTKNQTGMGLPLVQSYMESVGGTLKYENLYPEGFSVSLLFQIDYDDSI